MKAVNIVFAIMGSLLLLIGASLIGADKGGGDIRLPLGLVVFVAGVLVLYGGVVGGLAKSNNQTPLPDHGGQNIWQGFLRLGLIRKVWVMVALSLIAIAVLLLFNGAASNELGLFIMFAFGYGGITLLKKAWPNALAHLGNSG